MVGRTWCYRAPMHCLIRFAGDIIKIREYLPGPERSVRARRCRGDPCPYAARGGRDSLYVQDE